MENKKGIFNVVDVAKYICHKYYFDYSKEKKEISPIKLQKSLYFLFAYWGGFIRKSNDNVNYVEEKISLSEYLFDENFQAWVYGPVIPSIFKMYRDKNLEYKDFNINAMFDDVDSIVKESIDSLLDELFTVSDFKLVSVSHEDNCWKNHFNITSVEHNESIPSVEIIQEYALRESL